MGEIMDNKEKDLYRLIETCLEGNLSEDELQQFYALIYQRPKDLNIVEQLWIDHLLRLHSTDKSTLNLVRNVIQQLQSKSVRRTTSRVRILSQDLNPVSEDIPKRRWSLYVKKNSLRLLFPLGIAACFLVGFLALIAVYYGRINHSLIHRHTGSPYLSQMEGDVFLYTETGSSMAYEGQPIREKTTIHTLENGRVQLCFNDGTTIYLYPRTVFRINRLSPTNLLKDAQLVVGKVHCYVIPKPKDQRLVILTSHAQFEVIGTRFWLETMSKLSLLQVLEGKVKVTVSDPFEILTSSNRQQQQIIESDTTACISELSGLVSWKNPKGRVENRPSPTVDRFTTQAILVVIPSYAWGEEYLLEGRQDRHLMNLLQMLQTWGEKVIVTSYGRLTQFDLNQQRLVILWNTNHWDGIYSMMGMESVAKNLLSLQNTSTPVICCHPLWATLLGIAEGQIVWRNLQTVEVINRLKQNKFGPEVENQPIGLLDQPIEVPLIIPKLPITRFARPVDTSGNLVVVAGFEKGESHGGYRLPGRRIYFPILASPQWKMTPEAWELLQQLIAWGMVPSESGEKRDGYP